MKRLYARIRRAVRRVFCRRPSSGFVFIANRITMTDPTTGRVLWSISKDGGFSFGASEESPSEILSRRSKEP